MTPTAFDAKHLLEVVPLRFPFSLEIGAGASIVSAAITCTTKRGSDASPSATLLGSPTVIAGDVLQLVRAGVAGCTYLYVCAATLSNGQVLVRAGLLPVIDFV